MSTIRVLLALLFLSLAATQAQAAPPLAAYGALPAIEFMSLSPSGDRMAFIAVDGDQRKLFVRKVGGDALSVAAVGDAKVRDIQWAGEDNVVIFISRTVGKYAKGEFTMALVLQVKTGKAYRVFEKRADVLDIVLGYQGSSQIDGHWYGFFLGYSQGISPTYVLYRLDYESGEYRRVADAGAQGVGWVLGDHGDIVARTAYDIPTQEWRLLAGASGDQIVYRKRSPLGEVAFEGLGRTPGTVIVSDKTDEEDLMAEVALGGGEGPEPLPQSADYDHLLTDTTTRLAIGAELRGDKGLVFFQPRLEARWQAVRKLFPTKQARLVSYNAAMDRLIVFTEGGDDAGTFWLLDARTGKAEELSEAYPAIKPADVGPTRTFSYTAADGQSIDAVLTTPPGRDPKDLPLVVMPHGGPIDIQDRLGFSWWAQAYASRGYAVLQPNYRGSGGYGGAFRKAGFGQWGRKMQTDLSDGVAALARTGVIDPKRVCIVGGSYGGYAALAGVTLQKGVYRCAVSYGGVSDLGQMLSESGDGDRWTSALSRFERKSVGATWAGDPVLKATSPVYHAEQASAPILLIHGKDDTVVPISHSEHMATALQHAGATYVLTRLGGEDHWLSKQKTRTEMLNASVAFVEKWNPAN